MEWRQKKEIEEGNRIRSGPEPGVSIVEGVIGGSFYLNTDKTKDSWLTPSYKFHFGEP